MNRELILLNKNMNISFCYKAKEICLYDKVDNLCHHGDTEKDSIDIIKEYCKSNNIDIYNLVINKDKDYLLLLDRGFYN